MTETEKQNQADDITLNDRLIRLIGIPFFAIVIPNAVGIFGSLTVHDVDYWISYIFFITLSALIWQGNRYLLFRIRKRFTWFDRPIEKLILLVFNNVFYTAPITVAVLYSWYAWISEADVNWSVIKIITLINIICVLFITHVYETVFMLREQQHEQLKNAQLLQAKAEAELTALKNQVDPHFMFNSLNALTYLIQTSPSKAFTFTENLAEVYRYILNQKDRTLVLLEDELDFTRKYTDLLHLRFGEALIIRKHFNGNTERRFLIPPTSVFVAFENAVKHNEISEQYPLQIHVKVTDECLIITNSMRPRGNVQQSCLIGLRNLDERFKIITGKGIRTEKLVDAFSIAMPLISL